MKLMKTLHLSWDNVSAMICLQVREILGECLACEAKTEDTEYWAAGFFEPLSALQIAQLLDKVEAPHEVRVEALPQDTIETHCIGMSLSELLLKRYLRQNWAVDFFNADGLFLIEPKDPDALLAMQNSLRAGSNIVPIESLKTRQELMEHLQENGPTHSSLMDFCEEYRDKYCNELCWPYPISDGKHLGTFLVPVREGILSLPYDDADKVDYELFCLDDACMCDAESLDIFLTDWKSFSDELQVAIAEMSAFLRRQEAQNEK